MNDKIINDIDYIYNNFIIQNSFEKFIEQIKSDKYLQNIIIDLKDKFKLPIMKITYLSEKILNLINQYDKIKSIQDCCFKFFILYQILIKFLDIYDIETNNFAGKFFDNEIDAYNYFVESLQNICNMEKSIDEIYEIIYNLLLLEPMVSNYVEKEVFKQPL